MRSLLLSATLLVASCAAPRDDDPLPILRASTGDLVGSTQGVTAFAFHPRARIVRPMEGRTDRELREAADTALAAVLKEKGYDRVEAGSGALTFAYAVGVSGALKDEELMELFGLSAGVDSKEGDRAGLVLALVDLESGRLLWRGSASGPWERELRPATEVGTEIRAAFETLLADLPRRW